MMSFKQKRKVFNYWTKDRVDNGLRRYARDFFGEREKYLPKSYNGYLESMPENIRRRNRHLRNYPPPSRVLMQYRSFTEAWESLGFVLEYRKLGDWTRDEIVRGMKRVYAAQGYCPTDYREYHDLEKSKTNETIYPPLLAILDSFISIENTWLSSGFAVENKTPAETGAGDEFIAALLKEKEIEITELRETSALAQVVRRIAMRRICGLIVNKIETEKSAAEELVRAAEIEKNLKTGAVQKHKPKEPVVKKLHFNKNGQAMCRQNEKNGTFNIELTSSKEAVTCRSCVDILSGKKTLCRFKSREELPETAYCLQCETEKPIDEMMVVFTKKDQLFRLRPRCKDCHNKNERGNRREYKREYLKNWRENNLEKNESYWKNNEKAKARSRERSQKVWKEQKEAVLIQGRMNRHGHRITLKEANRLYDKFGRCYPTLHGLNEEGLRECERIRSRFRLRGEKAPKPFDIRLMVYADDNGSYKFVIDPENQPVPYRKASRRLKEWHEKRTVGENTKIKAAGGDKNPPQ